MRCRRLLLLSLDLIDLLDETESVEDLELLVHCQFLTDVICIVADLNDTPFDAANHCNVRFPL